MSRRGDCARRRNVTSNARHRDHRRRVLRSRRGDPAPPAGDRRFRRARAARRRGRHVVGEHLSGLRVRRAVASVLVLLRAEPGVEPDLLPATGDPLISAAARPRARPVSLDPARHHRHVGGVGRRRGPLDARDVRRPGRRPGADRRDGPPGRAAHPCTARARPIPGRGLPLGALGPRARSPRRTRRGGRHRGVRDPVRTGDPARGRGAARVPAHPAVGRPVHEPGDLRRRAAGCTAASRRCRRRSAPASTRAAKRLCWASSRTRG